MGDLLFCNVVAKSDGASETLIQIVAEIVDTNQTSLSANEISAIDDGMPSANVVVHSSQFPQNVRAALIDSLRSRRINHKFHYDSHKQAQKWLALHEAHSPARNDSDCLRIYDEAFRDVARRGGKNVHLIGLGCGGGQKEARLLTLWKGQGAAMAYSPCDVSLPLVLTARTAVSKLVDADKCWPVVCDLAEAEDGADLFRNTGAKRVVTFFGMIPNFEPHVILPRLRSVLRAGDLLLFSANLAPGENYVAGVQKILPQYDNDLTKDWLITLLLDLGVERGDGELVFAIEEGNGKGYLRVVANFEFRKACKIRIGDEQIRFDAGERIRLLFSYRYQPKQIVEMLKGEGIVVVENWITKSGEEGVFLCKLQS